MESKNSSIILEPIKKELQKMNINYEDLSEKKKDNLIKCELFLQENHKRNKKTIEALKTKNYSANAFAEYLGLSRGALYRKCASGENSYRESIMYLNSRSKYFITKDKKQLQQLFRSTKNYTEDYKSQIDKLVLRDVEYMRLKKENKELIQNIEKLEKQKAKLEKEVVRLSKMRLN